MRALRTVGTLLDLKSTCPVQRPLPPPDCGPVSSTLASLSDTWHRHADKSPRRKSTTAILGLARSQTLVQQVRRPLVRMKQALPLFEHFFVVSHLPQPPRAHR